MKQKKPIAVFIGRLSGLHEGQMQNIMHGLMNYERLIVFIGSVNTRRTEKNPFTYEERRDVLYESVPSQFHNKLSVLPLCDHNTYDEWLTEIYSRLSAFSIDVNDCTLVGHRKDKSTAEYLDIIRMPLDEIENYKEINATEIRKSYFEDGIISPMLTPAAANFFRTFKLTTHYNSLQKEFVYYNHIEPKRFEDYPYKEDLNFVTTDAVVTCAGHVLLVKRDSDSGDDVWALAGGFKKSTLTCFDNAIKELYEETDIDIPERTIRLAATSKDGKVFDSPTRCQGYPRVTHAYHFNVQLDHKGKLPRVRSLNTKECDTKEARWFTLAEIREMYLYDDHKEIIEYFTRTDLTPKKFLI